MSLTSQSLENTFVEGSDDEEMASTLSQSLPLSQKRATSSEMGIIQEIYCENFMCHRRMSIQLCPNINFITGENGSGKSAIIAALQICLGASARATHRGKSIKNLIRHGHDGNALVRITLLNDASGTDAFRPETFGRIIQVERLIRRDGTAEYRLKDEHGKVVSRLKSDLDAMLDHLNIQIENPCAVLDQENAKLFLKGDPGDKYKFFLQSTDLYKMRATFAKVEDETRMRQETTLIQEEKKLKTLHKAKDEAEKLYEEAKSIGHLGEELNNLKKSLAWSFVHVKESALQEAQAKLDQVLVTQQAAKEKLLRRQEIAQARKAAQAERNNALGALDEQKEAIQRQLQQLQYQIRELRQPVQRKVAEKNLLQHQIRQAKARIKRIDDERESKQAAYQQHLRSMEKQQARQAQAIEEAQEKLRRVQSRKRDLEAIRTNDLLGEIDEAEQQYENCKQQRRDLGQEIDRLSTRARTLESQSQDKLVAFGNKIPQLQQMIQNNMHKFSAPPIGPLGMYINLLPEFQHTAVAVEVVLKNVLQSYLVANGRDKALLDNFKRQLQIPGNQASIIIAKRSDYKYDGLRLPEGSARHHAVISLLDIEDPNVFNALIDMASIESKLIYDTREEAERATIHGPPGQQQFARGVSEVYVPNGDKMLVRSGNMAYIANKGPKHARILSHDRTAELSDIRRRLEYQKDQMNVLSRDEQNLRTRREDLRKQQQQHANNLDAVDRELNRVENELSNLQRQTLDANESNLGDTSMLDDEQRELEMEVRSVENTLEELERELSTSNPALDEKEAQLAQVQQEMEAIKPELEEAQAEVTAAMSQLSSATTKVVRSQNDYDEITKSVAKRTEAVEEHREIVENTAKKAKAFCPRVDNCDKPPEFYSRQIKDLQVRMEREKRRFDNMDLDELLLDKEDKAMKYYKKNVEFIRFSENVNTVATMLATRKRKWENLRIEIANRTSIGFNKFMQAKNFAGKLKFLHDEQILDINVMANEAGKTKQSMVSDMKQLSGGERSYTQVALLMALGDCIESPFRVMDEFDVFMDSINRTHTLQLLVETSKQASRKQFIFVTPNDLSSIKEDAMVKIQKLNPPRDGLSMTRN
ncbi:structural maintenance of chromosomes protein 6 [Thraustotheca clavata]|uniref:Structural maintenance of chromosomes protein 6 n=1 Tax=Thraustotheca clavata TaxID=74557 RepID=A0A1V9ZWG2_9STRA|nr:structural maintenance of chromosomes protein 6 [Thraustotheca clavata]